MPERIETRSKTIFSERRQEKLPICDKQIKRKTDVAEPGIKKKQFKNRKFMNLPFRLS